MLRLGLRRRPVVASRCHTSKGLANNRTVDVSAAADGSKRVVVAVTTGRKAFAGKKAAPKGKKAAAKAPEGRVKRTTVGAVSAKKALKAVAAITAAQRPDLKARRGAVVVWKWRDAVSDAYCICRMLRCAARRLCRNPSVESLLLAPSR